jgi:lipopolysaccharide export system permease protein
MIRRFERYMAEAVFSRFFLVLFGFVGMFSFFELVAELSQLGRSGYRFEDAVTFVIFKTPTIAYELLPLAALIGGLWAMADLASSSEFTVMRVSGLTPTQSLLGMLRIGLPLVLIATLLSEVVLPWSEGEANKARVFSSSSGAQSLRSGYWLRDYTQGLASNPAERFINIGSTDLEKNLRAIRVYEFDVENRLTAYLSAEAGRFYPDALTNDLQGTRWSLQRVERVETLPDGTSRWSMQDKYEFFSLVSPATLDALLVRPDQMSAYQLRRYVQYLESGRQKTARYELAFWKRVTFPLAVWTMLILALPAAYIHARNGFLGIKVFVGIGVGLIFYLINSLFGHLTVINEWPAPILAITPIVIAAALGVMALQYAQRRGL